MIDIIPEEKIKQIVLNEISLLEIPEKILNCLQQFYWKALIFKQDGLVPFRYTRHNSEQSEIYFDYDVVECPFLNYYDFILNYSTQQIKICNTAVELTIPEFNSYIDNWMQFEIDYQIIQNHHQRRFFFDFICSKQYVPAKLFCILPAKFVEPVPELSFTLKSVIDKFPNYFEENKNKYWMFYWRNVLYILEYSSKFELYISNRNFKPWRNNLSSQASIVNMHKLLNLKFQ